MTRLEEMEDALTASADRPFVRFAVMLKFSPWALTMLREAEQIIEFAEDNDIHAAEMAGEWLAKLREEAKQP